MMIDLSENVELMCVDGRNEMDKVIMSAKALSYSCKGISFKSVKLLSNFCPSNFVGEFIKIPNLTLEEYNRFMIKELFKYVSASYVLLVQWDGFVLRPHFWDNEFLNYDFIGAPWALSNRVSNKVSNRVGNGGFSLRSKKMINFASTLNFIEDEAEDTFLCRTNKELLELNGIKIAPIEVATRFSWETRVVENTFGFHGRHLPIHKKYMNLLQRHQ